MRRIIRIKAESGAGYATVEADPTFGVHVSIDMSTLCLTLNLDAANARKLGASLVNAANELDGGRPDEI